MLIRNSVSVCRSVNFVTFVNRSFKSLYSIEKIHGDSSLDWNKPQKIPSSDTKFSGYIPIDKLEITYSRSSGPGGQHVNKVNTKVDVRFHLESASWIPDKTRKNLSKLHHNRITKKGFMVVTSETTRLQTLNLADCMDKLRCYIREAEKPPPEVLPETLEIMKKRLEKAAAERIQDKRLKQSFKRMKNEGLDNVQI